MPSTTLNKTWPSSDCRPSTTFTFVINATVTWMNEAIMRFTWLRTRMISGCTMRALHSRRIVRYDEKHPNQGVFFYYEVLHLFLVTSIQPSIITTSDDGNDDTQLDTNYFNLIFKSFSVHFFDLLLMSLIR